MKKILTSFIGVATIASAAFAGTEYTGKEMRQTAVAPEECWYADNEWNVSLWGTYAFTGTESRGIGAPDFFAGGADGDRYLETDHAWGGGGDVKYFWHRYFGFGVEGFGLDAKRTRFDFTGVPTAGGFVFTKDEDRRAIGAVLGTFTIRYPIGCSRFAPYAWAGGGSIFGGGDRDRVVATGNGDICYGAWRRRGQRNGTVWGRDGSSHHPAHWLDERLQLECRRRSAQQLRNGPERFDIRVLETGKFISNGGIGFNRCRRFLFGRAW